MEVQFYGTVQTIDSMKLCIVSHEYCEYRITSAEIVVVHSGLSLLRILIYRCTVYYDISISP